MVEYSRSFEKILEVLSKISYETNNKAELKRKDIIPSFKMYITMNEQRVLSVINTLIELGLIEYKNELYIINWVKLREDYGDSYDFRSRNERDLDKINTKGN